ncbi:unnamed protein product, partial [Phaeothamnion confervicola]
PCATCGDPGRYGCSRCSRVRYCSRACQELHYRRYHKAVCAATCAARKAGLSLPPLPPARRGKAGLVNLGNTCFLSSAVQCLSHVVPLTRYLLSDRFRAHLNRANPLGTGGRLTDAYDAVLKELWFGSSPSVAPTELRHAISAHAPHFLAHVQHDSQEVLSFLLDGLHEDLNRVRKKPAVVMPDGSCGRPDAAVAAEAWAKFTSRDWSALVPVFYGQFKSTLVCPGGCGNVSRKFEEFNAVTVELPSRGLRPLDVLVV